jgi:hypothetical protein
MRNCTMQQMDQIFSSFWEADRIEQSFDKGWNSQHDRSSERQLPDPQSES